MALGKIQPGIARIVGECPPTGGSLSQGHLKASGKLKILSSTPSKSTGIYSVERGGGVQLRASYPNTNSLPFDRPVIQDCSGTENLGE